jgi:ABC-2 type transport system ATP-binding protein
LSIIETRDLTKSFGKVLAVDHITFDINKGETFGFLGPNGAGKTTTINMLTTLLNPTEGSATIAGFDVVKNANKVRGIIGMVPQDLTIDEDLTGKENILLHARLYHVPKQTALERMKEVLGLVDLNDAINRKVETFSGGMKKRLELAEGLIHYPTILFLDEPTLGLDVQTRSAIWQYIRKLRKEQNITIFLTTHYMEEADILCDRIAIIDHGKIKALDTPSNLKDGLGGDIIEVTLNNDSLDVTNEFLSFNFVRDVKRSKETYRIKVYKGEEVLPQIIEGLFTRNLKVNRVSLIKPTLDDVYLDITGRSLRDFKESMENSSRMRMNIRKMRH